jgi:hypothetical protein
MTSQALALLRSAGLVARGPVAWRTQVDCPEQGVYVVELPEAVARAPIDQRLVATWIARVATLRLDGLRPDSTKLAARLAAFWLPSRTVVYIGQTTTTVGGRTTDYYTTPLGDRSPHAGGHWIKTLACLDRCLVWWAPSKEPEQAEGILFDRFAATVQAKEAERLYDPTLVLPFANLQNERRMRKRHGVTGARLG